MRTLRVVTPRDDSADSEPNRWDNPGIRSLMRSLLAGISVWSILPVVLFLITPKQPTLAGYVALVTGFFVLPASLLVLWPLDGFLPRSSRFWHPGWMALLGLLSGTLFFAGAMGAADRPSLGDPDFWFTCLVCGGSYGAAMSSVLGFLNRRSR